MTSGGATHTTQVSPHRRNPDKPEAWADRTLLAVSGGSLRVHDARNREYTYPLATGAHHDPDSVAALVIARIRDGDKAGDGITEQIQLVTADKRTVCWMPAFGWNRDELQAFSTAAGLRFAIDNVGNFGGLHRAYPKVKGAPALPLYTAKGTVLLVGGLVAIIVVVGAILFALAM